MAAAATIAGLIRWVRAPAPWRPSKLRLVLDAQRSPGASTSSFIARHIEQPDWRHSKPASIKIAARPSASAWSRTSVEPGTIIARTCSATRLPRTTLAASRRSSMRALVQEPMKAWLMTISLSGIPASRPM